MITTSTAQVVVDEVKVRGEKRRAAKHAFSLCHLGPRIGRAIRVGAVIITAVLIFVCGQGVRLGK
jgi:hypothetical protein